MLHLRDCIKKVPRLTGCEAAYYFPQDIAVCPAKTDPSSLQKRPDQTYNIRDNRDAASGSQRKLGLNDGQEGRNTSSLEGEQGDGEAGDGNLVIHVRSGDIFFDRVKARKGQVSQLKNHRRDVPRLVAASIGTQLYIHNCLPTPPPQHCQAFEYRTPSVPSRRLPYG